MRVVRMSRKFGCCKMFARHRDDEVEGEGRRKEESVVGPLHICISSMISVVEIEVLGLSSVDPTSQCAPKTQAQYDNCVCYIVFLLLMAPS